MSQSEKQLSTSAAGFGVADAGKSLAPVRTSVESLERYIANVLKSFDVSDADAKITATVLATTDSWGIFTHGVKLLLGYTRRLRAGGLKPAGKPFVARQGPAWAMIDAQSCLGMVSSVMAMKTAIAKAKASGIGMAGVFNGCHFGAAGYYAVMAAEQGLIGMVMANDTPSMAVPGGKGRAMGTNPLAFAVPAAKGRPVFLDMALSAVAGGKVAAAALMGQMIPNNWVLNIDGEPSTHPSDFVNGGSLQPMAGHKGYGLALLVETLSGVLTGAHLRHQIVSWIEHDPTKPTGHGANFIAIDVAAMMPLDAFQQRMEGMVDDLHTGPKAKGSTRIYVPGEMEWERRELALQQGIVLPPDVVVNLKTLSQETGVELATLA